MPNELAVSPAIFNALDSFAPDVPPKPHRDNLEGRMDACLAQSAIPHRDQLVNILRVIGHTPTGLTLLDQFHQRFEKNNQPIVVNVLEAGAAPPSGVVAQVLWLPENLLTAHAQEMGVRPEVQHAPAVFDELAEALNAWRALETLEQGKQDCIEMGKRFRDELSDGKNPFTPLHRADSAESLRHDDARARERAATLIKQPGTSITVQQSGARPISVPHLPSESSKGVTGEPADPNRVRFSGQGSSRSLAGMPSGGFAPDIPPGNDPITEDGQAADNAQVAKQGKKPGAFKQMKTMRRQVAQQVVRQVRRPFNALMGLLERRRAESGKPDKVPQATVYLPDAGKTNGSTHSMISSTSSSASSAPSNAAPVRPNEESRLSLAPDPLLTTAPGTSAGQAGTPSTTETIVHA